MKSVDLLIFDLDGTLVDTRRDLTNAVNYARSRLSLPPLTVEQVLRGVGDGVENLMRRTLPASEKDHLAEALASFREYYRDHLLDFSRFYPGVDRVLKHFRDRKKAIVSNKPEGFTRKILQGLRAEHCFDIIVGGDTTTALKPDPLPVEFVLEKLRVAPANAVMIGDSPADIIAGSQAGTLTCAVTYGYRPRDLLLQQNPDFLVDAIAELLHLFT